MCSFAAVSSSPKKYLKFSNESVWSSYLHIVSSSVSTNNSTSFVFNVPPGVAVNIWGAVLSIWIILLTVVWIFPALSFEAYLKYVVPSVEIVTGIVYVVPIVGSHASVASVQYFVHSISELGEGSDSVNVTGMSLFCHPIGALSVVVGAIWSTFISLLPSWMFPAPSVTFQHAVEYSETLTAPI